MKRLLILAFILFSFNGFCDDAAKIKLYRDANIAYQKLQFEEAITLYEKLITEGGVATEVYYNLGNAFFKKGNIAKAIVNYERAKKLSPEDEDIAFNLKMASLKVSDRIDAVPQVFYKRWTTAIAAGLPTNTWSTIFIIIFWLTFASAGFWLLSSRTSFKKAGFIAMLCLVVFSFISYAMAEKSYEINWEEKNGVIISPSVYVKSSPDDKGNDLFILHEGTKVEVIEEQNDWKKIRIANGTIGWMKVFELEMI